MISRCVLDSFCQRPAERGPCLSFRQQWYFDAETGDCRTFQYGGCFGNQNNFDTKVDCMNYCNPGKNMRFSITMHNHFILLGLVCAFSRC